MMACVLRHFAFRTVSPFRIENVHGFQRHDTQQIREISKNKLQIVNPFKPWLLDTISKYQISGFLIIFDSVVCSPPEILPDRKFAEFSSEVASRIGRSGRARRTLVRADERDFSPNPTQVKLHSYTFYR